MNWDDERYVRLYTRDTLTWLEWNWIARAVFVLMLRKVDRAGVIDVGEHGDAGLAKMIDVPVDVVRKALAQITRDRTVEFFGDAYVVTNFLVAQEARTGGSQRMRDLRERRRALARREQLLLRGVTTPELRSVTDVAADTDSRREPAAPENGRRDDNSDEPSPKPRTRRDYRSAKRDVADRGVTPSRTSGVTRAATSVDEGLARVVSTYANGYLGTYGSKSSTPTRADQRRLGQLVADHGAEECVRRIALAFERPPSWPPGPWSLRQIVQHFDVLIPTSNAKHGRHEPQKNADYSRPPWED